MGREEVGGSKEEGGNSRKSKEEGENSRRIFNRRSFTLFALMSFYMSS